MTCRSRKKPATPEEQAALADIGRWIQDNFSLVQRVSDEFQRTGSWVYLEDLQRELDRELGTDAPDVVQVWSDGPRGTTDTGGIHGRHATLSVRVLAQVPSAKPLVDQFVAVVRLAMKKYRDGETTLTSDEICTALSLSAEQLARVSSLLFTAWPLSVNRTGGNGGRWVWNLDVSNRRFMDVETIDDFLDIQAKLMWRRPVNPKSVKGTLPPQPSDVALTEQQHRGWLTGRRLALIGIFVSGLVAMAVAFYELHIAASLSGAVLLGIGGVVGIGSVVAWLWT